MIIQKIIIFLFDRLYEAIMYDVFIMRNSRLFYDTNIREIFCRRSTQRVPSLVRTQRCTIQIINILL
jgi:hypothetical protein